MVSHSKHIYFRIALIIYIISAAFGQGAIPSIPNKYRSVDEALKWALDEANDSGTLVFCLAHERFRADKMAGKKRVFTLNNINKVRSYTDGTFTVIELPIRPPFNGSALTSYCTHYNAWVEWDTDRAIKTSLVTDNQNTISKALSDAKYVYNLIASVSDNELKVRLEKKAQMTERMRHPESRKAILNEFLGLCDDLVVPVDFMEIDNSKPLHVTNILTNMSP